MGFKDFLNESFGSVFSGRNKEDIVTVYKENIAIPTEEDDGSIVISPTSYGGGFTGTYLDLSIGEAKNEGNSFQGTESWLEKHLLITL